ncbi:WD40 repeat-like protein, partial [Microthyrium microscopicum]
DPREKDEEELELENMLFGSKTAFGKEIGRYAEQSRKLGAGEEEAESDEELEDDQLFFLDSEPSATALAKLKSNEDTPDLDEDNGRDPPAWADSDDDRIRISLATASRLRKLRKTEEEDVISGKDYIRRLKHQYQKLHPVPQWVSDAHTSRQGKKRRRTQDGEELTDASTSDDEMDVDSDIESQQPLAKLLRDATSLTRSSTSSLGKRKLKPEVIDIRQAKAIANSGPSAITSLQIHPTLPILLASGPSSRMDLYHLHSLSPKSSTQLTSLWMPRTPFTTTAFHPNPADARIFLSARRRYFHVWNLGSGHVEKITRVYGHADEQRSMERFKISPTGTHIAFLGTARKGGGILNVLDANSLQWVAQARVEGHGGIAEFAWWADGNGLCIASKNGEITEWSMAQQRTIARWRDEGAVGTTTIALGGRTGASKIGGDAWIAVGSSAGIVNVYSRRKWANSPATTADEDNARIPSAPKPEKVLDRLTTPISNLVFSPDGQVLAMSSRWKKDALRLVHLPTCTVFRNWPTANTPLGRISAVCWGEVEGVVKLVVGNEAGKIRCWEL